ncbi:hypothetical protein OG613_48805 (plasmid) [Streptomyces sp. NBC_00015]|uniref:hypothetical protein n=1 Tax=Streptomyces sp. NBC_00015 TaxID=2903611 RepID=UPI002F907581
MADEPDARRWGGDAARPRGDNVRKAIEWFTADRSRTRQAIETADGPIAPGELLDSARFDVEVNRLLDGEPAEQAQALVQAQAEWLVRWMPRDHNPLALDSAQQAGRAWGILITSDVKGLPDRDVLTEVAARTGISRRAVAEIHYHARSTNAAYNRADLISPYYDATEEILIGDWNRLAACGPELPEAAALAQDVLELLTARVTGTGDHDWMDAAAQHAAQVYASVIHAQPILASVAAVIPSRYQPGATDDQARLVKLIEKGHLAAAATAAARARAVQEWADHDSAAVPNRTRTVEAAAPGTRTLLHLNETLAALDPGQGLSAFTAQDQRVAQVVEAIGQLSTRLRTVLRTTSNPPVPTGDHPSPQRPHHEQHPPTPGQNPGGSTPRAAP